MAMFRTGMVVLAVTCAAAVVGTADAGEYNSKKEFVKAHVPSGSKMKMRTVKLAEKDRKAIKTAYEVAEVDTSVSFVLGRGTDGAITVAIAFVDRVLKQYNEWHSVAIALTPAGQVKEVAMLSVTGEYARMVDSKAFLGQFPRKKPAKGGYTVGDEINDVTGATMSAEVVADVVNMVMGVYVEHVREGK